MFSIPYSKGIKITSLVQEILWFCWMGTRVDISTKNIFLNAFCASKMASDQKVALVKSTGNIKIYWMTYSCFCQDIFFWYAVHYPAIMEKPVLAKERVLSVCQYVCLSVCISLCLSVCLSVCLSFCLSVCPRSSAQLATSRRTCSDVGRFFLVFLCFSWFLFVFLVLFGFSWFFLVFLYFSWFFLIFLGFSSFHLVFLGSSFFFLAFLYFS